MAVDWLAADPLDADALRALLTTRALGRPLEVHRRLTSTSDRVRELARAGARPGLVVLAEEQTQGRGRAGRRWESAPGAGLWMTALIAPGPVAPGLVTLGAGVAVRRAVARAANVAAALKWPNDLEVGGAKLCGILGEVVGEKRIALGIGLNVHEAPPAEAVGCEAAALDQAAGRPLSRCALAAVLLAELEQVLDDLGSGRQAQVLAAWREGCHHLGWRVRVSTGAGTGARAGDATGVAADIDATGALLLRRADGTVAPVVAGSLTVLAPPEPAPVAPPPGAPSEP